MGRAEVFLGLARAGREARDGHQAVRLETWLETRSSVLGFEKEGKQLGLRFDTKLAVDMLAVNPHCFR